MNYRKLLCWYGAVGDSSGKVLRGASFLDCYGREGQCSQPSRPDARAKRPNLSKTAVLVVDGRALQSLVRRVLPVVLCRARPSSMGPCRARQSSIGPTRYL